MEIYNFLMNNLSFSFEPLSAIVLWGIPLIISGLFTKRWRVLQGISGAVAQTIGTYLVLVIVVESMLGFFAILTYGYVLLAFFILFLVTVLTTPPDTLASIWAIDKWLHQGKEKLQAISAELHGFTWFVVVIGLIYLGIAIQKLFSPPVHIDCLLTYLHHVVDWFQTHSILSHSAPHSYLPQNNSLVMLWTILPFGTDQFINLQNLPAALLAVTAIFYILRIFRVNLRLCLLAGLAFLSLPRVAYWMWNQKPGILLSAFFILSVCFAIEYFERRKGLSLLYALCCAGLVAGTKTAGLYYGFLLYLVIIVYCIVDKRCRKWPWLLAGSIVCLIFTLEWPIYNWIIWKNPFYPFQVTFLGHSVFPGPGFSNRGQLASFLGTSIAANMQPRYILFLLKGALLKFGLVGLLALIAVPISFLAAYRMRMRRNFLFLSMITIGSYICYVFIPNTAGPFPGAVDFLKNPHNVYYAMPFFAPAIILLVIMISNVKLRLSPILEFVLLAQIIHGILINTIRCASFVSASLIMLTEGLIIAAFLTFLFCRFIAKINPKILWVVLGFGLALSSLGGGLVFEPAHKYKAQKRAQNDLFCYFTGISPGLFEWMEGNISKKTIVMCPLDSGYGILPYALFGSRLNNKVVSGPHFAQNYQPPLDIDVVVVSGKKKEGNDNDLIQLPPWTETWGENNGFHQVFSNAVQCVYERKK